MKKYLIMLLVITSLLLSSCNNNSEVSEEGLAKEEFNSKEAQIEYFIFGSSPVIAEGPDAYYHYAGNFVYAISKKDGKVRVLDNDPASLDDLEPDLELQKQSNAYFEDIKSIQYLDGKLYVLAAEQDTTAAMSDTDMLPYVDKVFELATDGSGQKEILRLEQETDALCLHAGYIYYASSDYFKLNEMLNSGEQFSKADLAKYGYRIERVSLAKPEEKPELVYEQAGQLGYINQMVLVDEYLYFKDNNFSYDAETGEINEEVQTGKTKILNTKNLEVNTLENTEIEAAWPAFIKDNKLVFSSNNGDINFNEISDHEDLEAAAKKVNTKLYYADLAGKIEEQKDLAKDIKTLGFFYGYGNYLFYDNQVEALVFDLPRVIQVLNLKGEKVGEIPVKASNASCVGVNDEYIFMQKEADTELENAYLEIYRFKLSELNKPEANWEEFFVYQAQAKAK